MKFVIISIPVIILLFTWLYFKTRFVIGNSSVSFLTTGKKRATLNFDKITGIEEDPGAGQDETGNIFFLSYDIYYSNNNGTTGQVKCNIYPIHEKKWDVFISKLVVVNPGVIIS